MKMEVWYVYRNRCYQVMILFHVVENTDDDWIFITIDAVAFISQVSQAIKTDGEPLMVVQLQEYDFLGYLVPTTKIHMLTSGWKWLYIHSKMTCKRR